MFAGGDIFEAWVTYAVNDGDMAAHLVGKNSETAAPVNLGTVNKFQLDSFFVKVWQDNGDHFDKVDLNYKVDDGDVKAFEGQWKQDIGGNDKEWGIKLDTNFVAELADGDHVLELWFVGELNPGAEKKYLNNGGANYKFNFKKGTPEPKVTSWAIRGSFNEWGDGFNFAGSDPKALTTKITVAENKKYEFKIIRIVTQGEVKDTTWFGLNDEGNTMKYGNCTNWNFYESKGEANQKNVGLLSTKAGEYTFTLDPTATVKDGENNDILAPAISVDIPEPEGGAASWFVIGSFNEWALGFGLTGTDDKALTAKITVEAKKSYEFKLIHVEGPDTTWYGLPDAGHTMTHTSCTDWVAYKSEGEQNQANVGLQSTKAGEYTFTVDVTHKDNDKVAPKFSVNIPEPDPDVREKREIVLHAGELTGDNACIILFAYTPGKEAFDVNMTLKEGDVFTAQIPKELDSLIIVRAAPGSTWGNLIWDGEGKTAWNQSYDQFIACDTVFFVDWVLETKYFNVSWCSAPEPPATAWYIKLPYGENDWDWHLMVEEEDGTWSHSEKWVGGGANVNTTMSDEGAKYIQDSEMDFGDNKVAPEKGTDCTFIWNATTQKLLVKYTKEEGIENVVYVLDENAPMYNLLGVEVDATFKGVVIQNGHKFIR